MINIAHTTKLIIAALIGASIAYAFSRSDTDSSSQVEALEGKIKELQSQLEITKQDLKFANALAHKAGFKSNENANLIGNKQQYSNDTTVGNEEVGISTPSTTQTMRNLESNSLGDLRPLSQKIKELLSDSPSKENIAIACKAVVDLAKNRDSLPDSELVAMYSDQTDANVKRVIAQVLSQRGNNNLIDDQVANAKTGLVSDQAADRQAALNNLAKTHSVIAVNAIAPLLHDPDINVKLDALLALEATGNETNVSMAEQLLNDSEPAVSSLATTVAKSLKNLSSHARTTVNNTEIVAELPPM